MSLLENSDKKIDRCELCGDWTYDRSLCHRCAVVAGGKK